MPGGQVGGEQGQVPRTAGRRAAAAAARRPRVAPVVSVAEVRGRVAAGVALAWGRWAPSAVSRPSAAAGPSARSLSTVPQSRRFARRDCHLLAPARWDGRPDAESEDPACTRLESSGGTRGGDQPAPAAGSDDPLGTFRRPCRFARGERGQRAAQPGRLAAAAAVAAAASRPCWSARWPQPRGSTWPAARRASPRRSRRSCWCSTCWPGRARARRTWAWTPASPAGTSRAARCWPR